MKIIQINCVYKKGSTGKIVYDLHSYYRQHGIDSYVIYGRGEKINEQNVYKVASESGSKLRNLISRYTGNLYGMGKGGLRRTIALIKKIKPDVVHLQCINGFFVDVYGLLNFLKEKDIPTLLTLHAEFMHTGNCGHAFDCNGWKTGCKQCPNPQEAIASKNVKAPKKNWDKMQKAFAGFGNLCVAGVSDWVTNRAKSSPILQDKKLITVLNGVDTATFTYKDMGLAPQIKEAREAGKKVILFVSPHFEGENKGGKWVLALAEKMKEEPIQFIVVGNAECQYSIENMQFIGPVADSQILAQWYAQADVTLLTSKRETFSMICAESLCCGTPIVGFEAGAPELIALKSYSQFVSYGDLDALAEAVRAWLEKALDKQVISADAQKTYAKQVMAENYMQAYKQLLGKKDLYEKN